MHIQRLQVGEVSRENLRVRKIFEKNMEDKPVSIRAWK